MSNARAPNPGGRGGGRGRGRGAGAKPRPAPRQGEPVGSASAGKSGYAAVSHAHARRVPLPDVLGQWARTPEGTETIVNAAIGVGAVTFPEPGNVVSLHGDVLADVDRAALLVEAVLDHRVRIHARLAVKERLDAERAKIQAEIDAGLRCEFPVQRSLMGMVMGHNGSRIDAATRACAVDRIVVDRDNLMIRIVASDPAEVRKAREMLEIRQEVVAAKEDRVRRALIGKGGVTITDIQRRSGAMSIDVDHDNGVVKIMGTGSATQAAKILIESHIATMADLDAAAGDLEQLRHEMGALADQWKDSGKAHYIGGGRFAPGGRFAGGRGGGRGGRFGAHEGAGRGGIGARAPPKPNNAAAPAEAPRRRGEPKGAPRGAANAAGPANLAPNAAPPPAPRSADRTTDAKSVPAPKKAAPPPPEGALEQRPARTRRRGGGGNNGGPAA